MATSAQLKSSIKQIEAAMKNKNLAITSQAKFKTQLDRLKGELASLNSPSPKKGVTKAKVMTSLQKLKATIKADKTLKGYRNSGIDIEKDADVPAMKRGVRTSKGLKGNQYGTAAENKGRKYYEYRLNRADVKQPPKKYPKLEDGGYMENGGEFGVDKQKVYFSSLAEVIEAIYNISEDNGYNVVDIFPDLTYGGISYGQTKKVKVELEWNGKEKRGKSKKRDNNVMNVSLYRMDSGNYELNTYFAYANGGYMAMGGIMEHGLEVGDNIYDADNENNLIFVENDSVDYEVNLSTGKRYRLGHSNERQDNYMAKGGKLYVKSYADDRREKALHGGKRISDEGNVYYENRLNHADVGRRVRLEDGGDIGSIKSNMHRYDK